MPFRTRARLTVPQEQPVQAALAPPPPLTEPAPLPSRTLPPGASMQGTIGEALALDQGSLPFQLRAAAPLIGGALAGPWAAAAAPALVEPLARSLEGRPPLPTSEELMTPEGQEELFTNALDYAGGIAGVVQRTPGKIRRIGKPFHGAPWEGLEGEKTIRLRPPHAVLPQHYIPEELMASKVRDEQGNLIRTYHGTRNLEDTQALDPEFLSDPWFGENEALYTTEQPSITTGYSVRQRAREFERERHTLSQRNKRLIKDQKTRLDDHQKLLATKKRQLRELTAQLERDGIPESEVPALMRGLKEELWQQEGVVEEAKRYYDELREEMGTIPPESLPGVRSDVRTQRPQTRAVYLNITNPFHVEKMYPFDEAMRWLDEMIPPNRSTQEARQIDNVTQALFEDIVKWNKGPQPDNSYWKKQMLDFWYEDKYESPHYLAAKQVASVLDHPQAQLMLGRIKQYAMNTPGATSAVETNTDLKHQFLATIHSLLPLPPRDTQLRRALFENMLRDTYKAGQPVSGGEILRAVKNSGQNTTEALSKLGYDGITHIGGGPPAHRVWIAFRPDQIFDAIPLEAAAERRAAGLPPEIPYAPHSVVGGPIWKNQAPKPELSNPPTSTASTMNFLLQDKAYLPPQGEFSPVTGVVENNPQAALQNYVELMMSSPTKP